MSDWISFVAASIGVAFAGLAIGFFVRDREAVRRLRDSAATAVDKLAEALQANADVAGVGDAAKGLAELAKALKDLSRALQCAFVSALFFLIAIAGAVGQSATDAATVNADAASEKSNCSCAAVCCPWSPSYDIARTTPVPQPIPSPVP